MQNISTPDKPFKTYEEQLDLLQNKYGLEVEDYDFALEQLKFFGYYDMISGYRDSFMRNDLFKENLSFQYIMDFIILDKNIQAVLLQCSAMAENTFKAKFAHYLADKYGVFETDYLDPQHYKAVRGDVHFDKVLKQFHYQLKGNNNPTAHYVRDYNHVPPWILFKNASFSTITDLFTLLKKEDKQNIAHALIPHPIKISEKIELILAALDLIRRYRNVIAHGLNFLYYKVPDKDRLPAKAVLMKLFPPQLISNNSVEIAKGESNIYAYFLCIILLFNNPYLTVDLAKTMLNLLLLRDNKLIKDYCQVARLPEDFLNKLLFIRQGNIFKNLA